MNYNMFCFQCEQTASCTGCVEKAGSFEPAPLALYLKKNHKFQRHLKYISRSSNV